MIPADAVQATSTPLREVLELCGFGANWSAPYAEEQPGYYFDCGDFRLGAVRVTSLYVRPVFQFGGVRSTSRSLGMISFEMPVVVESFEQGVAWIVEALRLQGYTPHFRPDWYRIGEEHRDLLPWERQRAACAARPRCLVERDWLRPAIKKLREVSSNADPSDVTQISFDGEILRFRSGDVSVLIGASGTRWTESYAVCTRQLDGLPRRLMQEWIDVSIWDGRMTIGSRAFKLCALPDLPGDSGEPV